MYEPFYLKDGNEYIQILFHEILYIEATDKYSRIVTTKQKYLIRIPLTTVERFLPSKYFCRINRSQIISVLHTNTFNNLHAIVRGKKLHIGKQYKDALPKRVLTLAGDKTRFIRLSDYDVLNLLRKIKSN